MTGASRASLAAVVCSACSFFVSGPPGAYDPRQPDPPDCTSSRTAPVLDTVGAGVLGAAGVGYLLARCGEDDHGGTDETCEAVTNLIGVVLLVPATVYAISAAVGYGKTGRCRGAHEDHARHRGPAPGVTPPG